MTTEYIISQIFTIISYIFLASTYHAKKRKNIIILNCLVQIAFAIAYILLKASTGLAMSIVALSRNIAMMINENQKGKMKKINVTILLPTVIASIVLSMFTYEGFWSLLPVIATILYTYAICQTDIKKYKLLGIPIEIMWVCYNIYIKSIFGIILEIVTLISCIIGYILQKRTRKIKKYTIKTTQKFKRSKKWEFYLQQQIQQK